MQVDPCLDRATWVCGVPWVVSVSSGVVPVAIRTAVTEVLSHRRFLGQDDWRLSDPISADSLLGSDAGASVSVPCTMFFHVTHVRTAHSTCRERLWRIRWRSATWSTRRFDWSSPTYNWNHVPALPHPSTRGRGFRRRRWVGHYSSGVLLPV